MVRTIVCDLDGSLMNPSSGIYVNEAVKEALIEVEKKRCLSRIKFSSMLSRCVSIV